MTIKENKKKKKRMLTLSNQGFFTVYMNEAHCCVICMGGKGGETCT